ncbi:MAG: O-antigen ligase family protein, partial [Actinomycetia bacterium]|nr:O-antigen ligase family protein [Actinomycetes bacterium]
RDVRVSLLVGAVGVVLAVALLISGVSAAYAAIPVATAGAVLLVLAGIFRFEVFVLTLIIVRAGADSLVDIGPLQVNAFLSILFLVFGLIWLAGSVRSECPKTITGAPSLLFFVAGFLSVLGAAQPMPTTIELLRVGSGLLMLEILQRLVRTRETLNRLLAALLLSAVVPIGLGLYQAATGSGLWVAGFVRVVGTFRHPVPYSIYLVIIILTIVALLPNVRTKLRIPLAIYAALAVVVLVSSLTRSAWMALALGIVVIAVLQSRWLIPLMVVVAIGAAVLSPNVMQRVTEMAEPGTSTVGDPTNSLTWRINYWKETLDLADGRTVTGIGMGMVQRSTPEEKAPHNDYLRVVVEGGVLALAGYIWLLVALVRLALKAVRDRGRLRGPPKGVAVGFVASLAALLLLGIVSNVISQVVLLWYVATIAALAAAAHHVAAEPEPVQREEALVGSND